MKFEPIAIVGSSCLLPGALDPKSFGRAVLAGEDLTSNAPEARWRMPRALRLAALARAGVPAEVADRGGFVTGFEERFDARGFALDEAQIRALDPQVQWLLHTAREALRSADYAEPKRVRETRIGAVFGNLSYPTDHMARFVENAWLERAGLDASARARAGVTSSDARDRFMSGLPGGILRSALGLSEPAFALDAACASSIYALKLACDRLHDGEADVMLAGAVCRVDLLNIHTGFAALRAFSRSGRSRPFHRDADGLLPAEGAAFILLKRLRDALAAGDRILGVVRGIGLSCDGRSEGLLTPSPAGQARAIRRAYELAELSPRAISLLECHATGTVLGDAAEIESTGSVFAGLRDVPLGSVKSNIGHALTVAGMAALLKVLECFAAGERAPTLHADLCNPKLDASPFRLVTARERWEAEGGPRSAGISAFGFGGNNAHLIVQEWESRSLAAASVQVLAAIAPTASVPAAIAPAPIAIVGVGVQALGAHGATEFAAKIFGARAPVTPHDAVTLPLRGLRFSPNDLARAIPQQTVLLGAALEAVAGLTSLPRERTSVLVGMGCDTEVCRWALRLRLEGWGETWGASPEWVAAAQAAASPELTPADVLGVMPNIVANRLNSQLDLGGPSFCVSSEERSGIDALMCAQRALRRGEIDAALVGAVDLNCEEANAEALRSAFGYPTPGDAAVVLVLKRLDDARAAGDEVYAVLGATAPREAFSFEVADATQPLALRAGHTHAASGLLAVATAALACAHRLQPTAAQAVPWFARPESLAGSVRVASANGSSEVAVAVDPASAPRPLCTSPAPRIQVYAGADRGALIRALESRTPSVDGPARLVLVAPEEQLDALAHKALARLRQGLPARAGTARLGEGIFFREAALEGELSFVFAGSGGAYSGMGRELVSAFPALAQRITARFGDVSDVARSLYAEHPPAHTVSNADRLWGGSLLSQLHAEFSLRTLGLAPTAAIGFCSGETNALFAMGAWHDFAGMRDELERVHVYDRELSGEFALARAAWQKRGVRTGTWQTWRLAADATQVRAALADEPLAHLTIINAPGDVVIAGHDAACARVIARLGPEKSRQLDLNLTIHTPEMVGFADAWRAIHTRRTTPVPGVRFYTHATLSHYAPDETSAADALVGQACKTVDFPALIENAWNDGVRIFLEHGPQGGCAAWIRRTLGDRPHVALALDSASSSSLLEAAYAAAELFVCGVAVDLTALDAHLARLGSPARELGPTRSYPAHWPSLRFPAIEAGAPAPAPRPRLKSERPTASRAAAGAVESALAGAQLMQPAPWLPPILGADRLERPARLAAQAGRAALAQESMAFGGAPRLSRSVAEQEITARSDRPADTRAASAQETRLRSEGSGLMRVPASAQEAITPESATHETARALHASYADLAAQQAAAYEAYLATARAAFARLLRASTGAGASLHAAAPTRAHASRSEIERSPAVSSAMLQPMAARASDLPRVVRDGKGLAPTPGPAPAPAPAPENAREKKAGSGSGSGGGGVVRPPVGLRCSRADLETLASGRISSVFGSAFASQDGYARQVRMPEPPLLLADRVLGIDGPAGVLGRGTIWTETDIAQDAWYAHCGRIPAGIFIEAGQADLLLISWMGIDAINRSERVYRLLGCEVTFSGGLPAQGDTIRYQIEIDAHAEQNGMRLFFFHYDGRVGDDVRISVRKGQAGFFTDAELEDSKGVLFDPADYTPQAGARVDAPAASTARRFDAAQVRAFAEGRPYDCFGPEFALTRSHTRSPSIEQGKLLLFDEVTDFDPKGGPWGRGYLRVTKAITPDAWFFDGHFKGDSCMPGTLMLQGTLQAMAFYLAALGYTIDRDGYRFEPVMGEPIALQCRGQVTPSSRELVAEIFVEELHDGPIPTLYAHVLGTVDGLKSLYGKRVGLRCVPDWPLTSQGRELLPAAEPKPVARIGDFPLGYASLLACAWGKPSDAFGPGYALFDEVRRCPRLPGPPYHFVSRVTQLSGPFGEPKAGIRSEFEYDVPRDAWYFGADASGAMPFAVLLEAALQPCGWTAAYRGIPMTSEEDVYFRNLEGTATAHADITPECGTLRTAVHFSSLARLGTTVIEAFDVECFRGEQRVYTMNTRFGHFPKSALAEQAGLPASDEQRARLQAHSEFSVDLSQSPAAYFAAELRLPERSLLMLDRVTGFWPTAGRAGLGVLRAEKSIDPGEWFFKAHFFQDPVQPGSLGIEAMIQLLRFYAIERGLGRGMKRPRFEPLALGRTLAWKYRGQVRPWNKLVTVDAEITECVNESDDPRRVLCVADASLWVDGTRIYEAKGLALRVVESSEER